MPDVRISVGGKTFTVACREGEETYLQTAAGLLDREATALVEQIGRIDDARMLLMAGLMLADRTAAFEERAIAAEQQLAEEKDSATDPVEVIPQGVTDALLLLATRAEGLADLAERQADP
ncbi:MAG: cell division protein ZapA [Pseudomonadota bacterium]